MRTPFFLFRPFVAVYTRALISLPLCPCLCSRNYAISGKDWHGRDQMLVADLRCPARSDLLQLPADVHAGGGVPELHVRQGGGAMRRQCPDQKPYGAADEPPWKQLEVPLPDQLRKR